MISRVMICPVAVAMLWPGEDLWPGLSFSPVPMVIACGSYNYEHYYYESVLQLSLYASIIGYVGLRALW